MKKNRFLIALGLSLSLSSAFAGTKKETTVACRYTTIGDFKSSADSRNYKNPAGKDVRTPGDLLQTDITMFRDQESCMNPHSDLIQGSPRQICTGLVECEVKVEEDGKPEVMDLRYESVACSSVEGGKCPGAVECMNNQKKQKIKVAAIEAKETESTTLDPSELGESCANNFKLGGKSLSANECYRFCVSRCRKVFYLNKNAEIDTCISSVSGVEGCDAP
jgi:hypothetical protein